MGSTCRVGAILASGGGGGLSGEGGVKFAYASFTPGKNKNGVGSTFRVLHRSAKFCQDKSRHSLMHADLQSFVSSEKQDAEPTTETSRLTKQMVQRELLSSFDFEPTHRSLRTALCVHSGPGCCRTVLVQRVPAGSPSRGEDVTVYV